MTNWQRRLRGAIGMGLAWGTAWLLAGLALLAVVGLGAADVPFPLFFGFLGFWAGAAFSVILGVTEHRRTFDQMSVNRFAGWGGLGGLLLAGLVALAAGPTGEFLTVAVVFALAGAGSATGTLLLARRAERQRLLDTGPDDSPPSGTSLRP